MRFSEPEIDERVVRRAATCGRPGTAARRAGKIDNRGGGLGGRRASRQRASAGTIGSMTPRQREGNSGVRMHDTR